MTVLQPAPEPVPERDQVVLVDAAKTGNADAFAELYTEYLPVVRRVIYARMRHNARHEADDLIAETFTRAWANIARFTWRGRDFGAWLTRIAVNLVRDWYKSAYVRHVEACSDLADLDAHAIADRDADPLDLACKAGDIDRLRTALMELTDMQKECVYHRVYCARTGKETAAIMGMHETAIKALLHRAVRTLRREFGQDD